MEEKHLEKLAKMILVGVPQKQIASSLNLSEGRISQIIITEEYKTAESKVAAVKFQEAELINKGWDGIEARGIKRVLDEMKHNPDPEFALKASIAANKALRRGDFKNNPIVADRGVKAVIHLNPVFVEKLQQNFEISETKNASLTGSFKDSDFMPAKSVHELLGSGEQIEQLNNVAIPTSSPQLDEIKALENLAGFPDE